MTLWLDCQSESQNQSNHRLNRQIMVVAQEARLILSHNRQQRKSKTKRNAVTGLG